MNLRWRLGKGKIVWAVDRDQGLPHSDQLEMSGRRCSLVVAYGVDAARKLTLKRSPVFPEFRFAPNSTRDGFLPECGDGQYPRLTVDGESLRELVETVEFDGVLSIKSVTPEQLAVERLIFPSPDAPLAVELLRVVNQGARTVKIAGIDGSGVFARGIYGCYRAVGQVVPPGTIYLAPGESRSFSLLFAAGAEDAKIEFYDAETELLRRRAQVAGLRSRLIVESGINWLDAAVDFGKIRAGESVFSTRSGLLPSPGASYYAGIWCNDQLEYSAPYFALNGDPGLLEACLNSFALFRPFMGEAFFHLPSAIVSEGMNIWEGRGDRGDAAMYAYAAALFMLFHGDRASAERLFPALEWCLEYTRRRLNKSGVVVSDTDELETRLSSGVANLNTNSLYYGALVYGARAAADLGRPARSAAWKRRAAKLGAAIDAYFGADLAGFHTYRYHEGNSALRAWIGLPLCVGLERRAEGTVAALLSDHLRKEGGLLSSSSSADRQMMWDRSALYAFRGIWKCGKVAEMWDFFREFVESRLLGEHIPYCCEAAMPVQGLAEGSRRHSAAESALLCRIVSEAMFGLDPVGLERCRIAPRLPHCCDEAVLRNIQAFGCTFDLTTDGRKSRIDLHGGRSITVECGGIVNFGRAAGGK